MRVSPDSALRLAAVYACVRILAETIASLPLVVYQRRPDGGKDRVTDHWLYRLMSELILAQTKSLPSQIGHRLMP